MYGLCEPYLIARFRLTRSDNLDRSELDLVASQRRIQATYNQIKALRRGWQQQFSVTPNKVKQPQMYIRSMYHVTRIAWQARLESTYIMYSANT
jgi:hypothetical protein